MLARRVMGELLRENQIEKVAVAVELIGPGVVEDLRGDPACASALREAAALLVDGRPRSDTREIVDQLHRRILKHRMVGADDPVEQEFAFLLGVSPARLAAVLDPEPPSVRAAALRYAPAHLRSTYLESRSTGERAALAAAIASPKSLSKEHLLDVAATLRARAIEQAHLDSGQTGDIDLAVELVEERPMDEQAEILDAMRRADPAKARAVEAALITEQSFELVSEEVLGATVVGVPTEILARFLRTASATVASRTMATLPRTVAAALEEDLSLVVAPTPRETAEARRALFAALRQTLRARGLQAPQRRRREQLRQRIRNGEGQGKDGGTMKTRSLLLALLLASASAAAGCTIITPPSPDGGMTKKIYVPVPFPIRPDALPQPPPLTASVLFVANLARSSVNLSNQYAAIMTGLLGYLAVAGALDREHGAHPDLRGPVRAAAPARPLGSRTRRRPLRWRCSASWPRRRTPASRTTRPCCRSSRPRWRTSTTPTCSRRCSSWPGRGTSTATARPARRRT